jgi:hypothetical protein
VQEDSKRLDFLDLANKRLNDHYGTKYGWKYNINCNRASLTDSNIPALSIRGAIDDAIKAASTPKKGER